MKQKRGARLYLWPVEVARTTERGPAFAVPHPHTPWICLGRLDSQVKVLGHRVELGEVEAVVRNLCGVAGVVAVAWPNSSNTDGIELFLEAQKLDTELLMKQLKTKLPNYMVPRRIRTLARLPLNPNGKYDRKTLAGILSTTSPR